MLASVLVALFGIWLARSSTLKHPEMPERIAAALERSVPAALQQILRGPDLRRDVREPHQGSGDCAGGV